MQREKKNNKKQNKILTKTQVGEKERLHPRGENAQLIQKTMLLSESTNEPGTVKIAYPKIVH